MTDLSSILKRVGNKKQKLTQKKARHVSASIRLRKAAKIALENGGNKSAAMREAGFSEAYAKNPQKLSTNKGYQKILDEAGLSDEFLANGHKQLANASRLQEYSFPHTTRTELIQIDEDHEKWDPEGRKKQFVEETKKSPITDKEIKEIIEKIPGANLLYIRNDYDKRIAYFSAPDYLPRGKALEMGYKAKGLFAAEKVEFTDPELTPEEQAALKEVFGNNAKA